MYFQQQKMIICSILKFLKYIGHFPERVTFQPKNKLDLKNLHFNFFYTIY